MINKNTIENTWKQNPLKIYHVIQNPRIDIENKKVIGLTIKSVDYIVKDWDAKVVNFERCSKMSDKRFPEILTFDKRSADAENEIFAEKVSKVKNKNDVLHSYAIFLDAKLARYHKLVRLHRLAQQLIDIHDMLENEKNEKNDTNYDEKNVKYDGGKINFSLIEVKDYFKQINETNYFDELESIQSEFPDLAVM